MKAITNCNLNRRIGAPYTTSDLAGYLLPGTEITIAEMCIGQSVEGNNIWYKGTDEYYYWSGGFMEKLESKTLEQLNLYPEWMLNLKIPQIWNYATGKNVGVAVIDTGIALNNNDLPYDLKKFYIFDKSSNLQDTDGHGTHCTGLIGARNKNGNIIGTAPDCNLFVCKISEGFGLTELQTVRYADAINWCANQKNIHVISISWGSFINNSDTILKIHDAVNSAINAGKVVACAIGDATQFNDPGPLYPASLDNTIAIGSVPVENILYPYMNQYLLTITEGYNIPSFSLDNQIVKMSGTSQSNAIVAGIIALIIEKKAMNYSKDDIRKILLSVSSVKIYNGVQIPTIDGDLLLQFFQT
jgi:subtilisin family serine protease